MHVCGSHLRLSAASLPTRPVWLLQEVKGKTAQMDADLAARQAALEAQEQARDIARDQLEAIDGRVAALGELRPPLWGAGSPAAPTAGH